MSGGRGNGGNRAVSPLVVLGVRGDLRAARAEAIPEEGGSWGKHGFPNGSEPQASDAHVLPLMAIETRSFFAGLGAIGSSTVSMPRS
jgi:hypothetical protein